MIMQFCCHKTLKQTVNNPNKRVHPTTTICKSQNQSDNQFNRRDYLLHATAFTLSLTQLLQSKQARSQNLDNQIFELAQTLSEKEQVLVDDQLAYTFKIPAEFKSGSPIKFAFSRKPEKYSSAAPLTADSRQRIVCELVDFTKGVALTVFVGPANKELMQTPVKDWNPKEVARLVLSERSNAKNSEGRRIPISQVETADVTMENGQPYFEYEHIQQGSPNIMNPEIQTFRRALAVTTTRPAQSGQIYLYSFNVACPEVLWPEFEAEAIKSLASFKLLAPGKGFIDPEQNPWLFF